MLYDMYVYDRRRYHVMMKFRMQYCKLETSTTLAYEESSGKNAMIACKSYPILMSNCERSPANFYRLFNVHPHLHIHQDADR